jgi:excisionase family DNA binding protein
VPPEQLITTRQLAELWQQTPRWVLRMANEHGLPHYKLGGATRYRTSEVEAWLQQHRAGATVTTLQGDEPPVGLRSVSDERGAA